MLLFTGYKTCFSDTKAFWLCCTELFLDIDENAAPVGQSQKVKGRGEVKHMLKVTSFLLTYGAEDNQ